MQSDTEIWRQCVSAKGLMVSNMGRVMHIPHIGKMPHGGIKHYGGYPNFGIFGDAGRRQVTYKGKTIRVHKLVAEAFLPAKPFKNAVIIHIDENNQNNTVSNLKWGTQKENLNAPGFIDYCKSRVGENNPHKKGVMKKRLMSQNAQIIQSTVTDVGKYTSQVSAQRLDGMPRNKPSAWCGEPVRCV